MQYTKLQTPIMDDFSTFMYHLGARGDRADAWTLKGRVPHREENVQDTSSTSVTRVTI
jgi:hypothetical protein